MAGRPLRSTRVARAINSSARAPPLARPTEMLNRSFISVVNATFQPSDSPPRRALSGTRRSSMNTSLKLAPPEIWRIGRVSMAGSDMSTRNMVNPLCLGTCGSVRAKRIPWLE